MFNVALLLLFLAATHAYSAYTGCSDQQKLYFKVAMELIEKAINDIPSCVGGNGIKKAVDCADLYEMGQKESGIYEIWPMNRITQGTPLKVYCDMDTDGGGWTVIQRRGQFEGEKEDFNKDWKSYKKGFGDLKKEFWLGNDNIFVLTNQKHYSARFDLEDVNKTRSYAVYGTFWIDDEERKYTLHLSNYSGNAGDAMTLQHNNEMFSTNDEDNDSWKYHCAESHKSGWWFNHCASSNLNGVYPVGKRERVEGIWWQHYKGAQGSLEWTEMKIRPLKFL